MSEAAARLREAEREHQQARQAVEERGRDGLEQVADAYGEATKLLDNYVDTATGSGDFQAYVEFQERFATLVEDLPEDVAHRDAFETALDRTDKRRLSESDFQATREALEPAEEAAELLEAEREAREAYREAEKAAKRRLGTVKDRIAECERLQELGEADLDAPVEDLRGPIETYDEAVVEAFQDYRLDASAREVLAFAADAAEYPLVAVREPPTELVEFVESHEAGTETIPRLLELADYSRSKLEHYVDDPVELTRAVSTRQTYLDRLDGSGLRLGWPPGPAEQLRRRCEERISLVSRFASEDVVATLRTVRELTWREDYDRLRTAAVALTDLGEEERERLASGAVADELADLREEKAELQDVLGIAE
ncbi:DUF7118 family protein [Haloarchaeobius amylolyticus]|uniref:DUF7118 family protein n=1 Tax=Haloarchaeobius amylolyticus TaxID=1198296 RepID=UPI0022706292|nr:hypothetical protein [Haloarchaeobius amylolyticus]